jgi:hypothetical protein
MIAFVAGVDDDNDDDGGCVAEPPATQVGDCAESD